MAFCARFAYNIGSAPLASTVKRGDTVVITHSDITRATPNDPILPLLLAELEAAGVRRDDITLLNALGTHRKQTAEELRRMLGDFVFENYRCPNIAMISKTDGWAVTAPGGILRYGLYAAPWP